MSGPPRLLPDYFLLTTIPVDTVVMPATVVDRIDVVSERLPRSTPRTVSVYEYDSPGVPGVDVMTYPDVGGQSLAGTGIWAPPVPDGSRRRPSNRTRPGVLAERARVVGVGDVLGAVDADPHLHRPAADVGAADADSHWATIQVLTPSVRVAVLIRRGRRGRSRTAPARCWAARIRQRLRLERDVGAPRCHRPRGSRWTPTPSRVYALPPYRNDGTLKLTPLLVGDRLRSHAEHGEVEEAAGRRVTRGDRRDGVLLAGQHHRAGDGALAVR